MVAEFERYGLGRLRVFTATLQIVGSLGLLAGYYSRPLLLLSAGGFTAMTLLALLVRVRIRDPLVAVIPAFVLMCLNLFLTMTYVACIWNVKLCFQVRQALAHRLSATELES